MKRSAIHACVAAAAALGLWQLCSGLYIHAKAWLAQELIASAWSRTLQGSPQARPWPWADTWPVARLRIPEAGVDLYVLADASGRSLAFGPGHVSGTAPPGSAGHSMIAGHRDTHFGFLRGVHAGARIRLETGDGLEQVYRVLEAHVFDTRHERLALPGETPTLTLLTCFPFDALAPGGPLRYAVVAESLEPSRMRHGNASTPLTTGSDDAHETGPGGIGLSDRWPDELVGVRAAHMGVRQPW